MEVIKRIESTARGAPISQYSRSRPGYGSGRRQKRSDSYKPHPSNPDTPQTDRLISSAAFVTTEQENDFQSLFNKM